MQTQNDRVLNYLERHGDIDPMRALTELGVFRLAARVKDLRDAGVSINKTMARVTNRFGESCHVAKYWLEKQEGAQ